MNSLTWLLYAIYLIGAVKTTILILMIISLIVLAITIIIYGMSHDEQVPATVREKSIAWWGDKIKKAFITSILTLSLFVFIPSQSTFKLMVASEVAGYLLQTDAGQKVINETSQSVGKTGEIVNDSLDLLHQYIKKELQETVAPTTESGDKR